jgi:hypothetical protein
MYVSKRLHIGNIFFGSTFALLLLLHIVSFPRHCLQTLRSPCSSIILAFFVTLFQYYSGILRHPVKYYSGTFVSPCSSIILALLRHPVQKLFSHFCVTLFLYFFGILRHPVLRMIVCEKRNEFWWHNFSIPMKGWHWQSSFSPTLGPILENNFTHVIYEYVLQCT